MNFFSLDANSVITVSGDNSHTHTIGPGNKPINQYKSPVTQHKMSKNHQSSVSYEDDGEWDEF